MLATVGGLALHERPAGPATRIGLYAIAVGGPGGRAELDVDDVEELADVLEDWLERNGRRR